MATVLLVSYDFNKLESLNFRFQNLASDPSSPVSGGAYFNTATKRLRIYDGVSAWVEMGAGGGTVSSITLTQPAAGLTVSNSGVEQTTTGSFTFTLANDLAAIEGLSANGIAVRTATDTWAVRTLMGTTNQVTVTNGDGVSGNPTISLPQNIHTAADVTFKSMTISESQTVSTAGSHAARIDFVLGLVNGLSWKQSVRTATSAAGTLASSFANGSTVGGIVVATNDRILIKDQAAPAENGIYIVNASGAPTRAADADSWTKLINASVCVQVGDNADSVWNCNVDAGGTLGSTAVTFVQMPSALTVSAGAGLVKNGAALDVNVDNVTLEINADAVRVKNAGIDLTTKVTNTLPVANGGTGGNTAAAAKTSLGFVGRVAQDIGDGASTSIAVTHNLGTLDVSVQVYRKSDGVEVWCDVTRTSTNVVTLGFAVAPTAAQYRVVVVG